MIIIISLYFIASSRIFKIFSINETLIDSVLWKTFQGNAVNFVPSKFSVSISLNGYDHITLYREVVTCQAVLSTSGVHHVVKSLERIFLWRT